jgi:hypothetical protein
MNVWNGADLECSVAAPGMCEPGQFTWLEGPPPWLPVMGQITLGLISNQNHKSPSEK